MLPFFTHAIEGEEFRDVEIQGFEGRQALGVAIALVQRKRRRNPRLPRGGRDGHVLGAIGRDGPEAVREQ